MDLGPSNSLVLRPQPVPGCLMEGPGLPLQAPGASRQKTTSKFALLVGFTFVLSTTLFKFQRDPRIGSGFLEPKWRVRWQKSQAICAQNSLRVFSKRPEELPVAGFHELLIRFALNTNAELFAYVDYNQGWCSSMFEQPGFSTLRMKLTGVSLILPSWAGPYSFADKHSLPEFLDFILFGRIVLNTFDCCFGRPLKK